RVSLPGVITYRVGNGKLAERWGTFDLTALEKAITADLSKKLADEGKASINEVSQQGFKASGLGPPPRTLTPEMEAYAAQSGWQINWWVMIILMTVFSTIGLFILIKEPGPASRW